MKLIGATFVLILDAMKLIGATFVLILVLGLVFPQSINGAGTTIPLFFIDGGIAVRVEFNGMNKNFQIDTGSSTVSLNQTLGMYLIRMNMAHIDLHHPVIQVILADGSKKVYAGIIIHKMKIGAIILTDVEAVYAPDAAFILGNNVLSLLPPWSIDYKTPALRFITQ